MGHLRLNVITVYTMTLPLVYSTHNVRYFGLSLVEWEMVFEIKNKVALITGGASGIGLNYAKELLRNDAKVSRFFVANLFSLPIWILVSLYSMRRKQQPSVSLFGNFISLVQLFMILLEIEEISTISSYTYSKKSEWFVQTIVKCENISA